MRKIGLVLGKFSILHKGHQFLIETALSEMDSVYVLVYDSPTTTRTPLDVRASWIKRLYPSVNVIEGWCGPEDSGYTEDVIRIQNEYILKMAGDKGITHFYSSEPYGDHVSVALGCENRTVDIKRETIPIAASAIQKDMKRGKSFVDPLVWRDLIINICFVGAPSTGKTTISEEMAKELGTVWMPEYGREYWEKHQSERRLTPEQLVEIARTHLELEDKALEAADKYLFTDTNAITTFMFALDYHGYALPELHDLARVAERRYDLVFLCGTDIPYDDTPDRSGDVARQIFQRQIESDLLRRRIPYITLTGGLRERMDKVTLILSKFEKYRSICELAL
ncbi:MAG: AAA family ATPase [Clostridiales bacterium]|jgi:NadR type nicotinamide-nucleotide adenylyltransferase|nr:AAA family ATPase [Clostridiales bacterium]